MCRWDPTRHCWLLRKRRSRAIGHVVSSGPASGDARCLAILLCHDHCRSKQSFDDMLLVEQAGVLQQRESYRDVCLDLGLLETDDEWARVLDKAARSLPNGAAQRGVFVTVCLHGQPNDPQQLYVDFAEDHYPLYSADFTARYVLHRAVCN